MVSYTTHQKQIFSFKEMGSETTKIQEMTTGASICLVVNNIWNIVLVNFQIMCLTWTPSTLNVRLERLAHSDTRSGIWKTRIIVRYFLPTKNLILLATIA